MASAAAVLAEVLCRVGVATSCAAINTALRRDICGDAPAYELVEGKRKVEKEPLAADPAAAGEEGAFGEAEPGDHSRSSTRCGAVLARADTGAECVDGDPGAAGADADSLDFHCESLGRTPSDGGSICGAITACCCGDGVEDLSARASRAPISNDE